MSDKTLVSDHFSTNLARYWSWLWSACVVFCLSVVCIQLLLLWFPSHPLTKKRYINSMSAEKTEPVDNIKNMALIQGYIMHVFGRHQLSIVTEGKFAPEALISLMGDIDVTYFRAQILAQKSPHTEQQTKAPLKQHTDALPLGNRQQTHATLIRIEQSLTVKQSN
jgi:putative membrane protein